MKPKVAAIVPAYNEESTVGRVVRALCRSGVFSEVLVVSDGSTDRTADVARRAGAAALVLPRNVGKGRAMRAGVRKVSADIVAFFDADMLGLRRHHIRSIVDPVVGGEIDMQIGLMDRGFVVTKLMEFLPLISGQRALRRDIFLKIPVVQLEGYRVEAALNYFCARYDLRVATVPLQGLRMKTKLDKVGLWKSAVQYARMWRQVFGSMLALRLRTT